jgi:hypothetical protein
MGKSFDMSLIKDKPANIMSSEKALKDIEPFNWSEDVLNGKTKVTFVLAEDTKKEP